MGRLRAVPGWVRPPLRAVARVEDFTLRLYDRTRSPEVLGSWTALTWLDATSADEPTPGPYGRGLPTHAAALQALRVADALAEGCRYPPETWWTARGFGPADRLAVELWDQQAHNLYDRAYAHGVRVALGWLLGELHLHEVGHMAPIHHEDGGRVDGDDRELYAQRLRDLVADVPTPAVRKPVTTG